MCIVLGRALLFKIFDSSPGEKRVGGVAPQIRARVMDAYACLGGRNTLGQGEGASEEDSSGCDRSRFRAFYR